MASHAVVRIPEVADYSIAEGRRIRIARAPGASDGVIALWLQGLVAAFLLAQRRSFALHASVIELGDRAIAVTARRGVGKSTTALALERSGNRIVTDDVAPVTEAGGAVTVHPFGRTARIAEETARRLGVDLEHAVRIGTRPKLTLPVEPGASPRLDGIVALRSSQEVTDVSSRRLEGRPALLAIAANAYRRRLLRELYEADIFRWAGRIAAAVPVHEVVRPAEAWTTDAVANAVREIASQLSRRGASRVLPSGQMGSRPHGPNVQPLPESVAKRQTPPGGANPQGGRRK